MPPEPANIKPLTSLRFFAAAWVVLYHWWPKLAVVSTPALIDKGYLGVELFFILSGFILCHVYLAAVETGRFRYADFLWARLARIYPMHLATLLGVGVMAGLALVAGRSVDHNVLSLAALPANLALVQAWGLSPVAGWNHPSWSISAEWFAYLTFPLFALAALKLRQRPLLAVAGALISLTALYALFQHVAGFPLTKATIAWGALRIIPCFALGCALHLAWSRHVVDRRIALLGASFFGVGALAAAALQAPDALIVAAFGGLIIALAQGSRAGGRLGTHPVLVYLGEISYSTYMICIPWQLFATNLSMKILHLTDKHLPWYLWLCLVSALIPLSMATHHLIERPARERMKQWWTSRSAHNLEIVTVR